MRSIFLAAFGAALLSLPAQQAFSNTLTDDINERLQNAESIGRAIFMDWYEAGDSGIDLSNHDASLLEIHLQVEPEELVRKQEKLVLAQFSDQIIRITLDTIFGQSFRKHLGEAELFIDSGDFSDALDYLVKQRDRSVENVLIAYPSSWDREHALAKYVPPIFHSSKLPEFVAEILSEIFGTTRIFFVNADILCAISYQKLNSIAVHEMKHLFDFEDHPERFSIMARKQENRKLERLYEDNMMKLLQHELDIYRKSKRFAQEVKKIIQAHRDYGSELSNDELQEIAESSLVDKYLQDTPRLFKYFHQQTERSSIRFEAQFLKDYYGYSLEDFIETRRKELSIADPSGKQETRKIKVDFNLSNRKELEKLFNQEPLQPSKAY
jgi:hypothetical protein